MRKEFCDHCGKELPAGIGICEVKREIWLDSNAWFSKTFTLCRRCEKTIRRWLHGKPVPEIDSEAEEVERDVSEETKRDP